MAPSEADAEHEARGEERGRSQRILRLGDAR